MDNKIRELTCIVCPRGCALRGELAKDEVISITGNFCKRGPDWAKSECTNPTRTVTSTVRLAGGGVVPVKTSAPVPKKAVFDVMKAINTTVACRDVKIGDVIIENVLGTGVDIVATANS